MSAPFPAHYDGWCALGEHRFHASDEIVRLADGDGYACRSCGEGDGPVERPEPDPCPTCWLVHPEGACDR